jgi:hypothetical protein
MGSFAHIIDGSTRIATGVPVRYTPTGLIVTDGSAESEIPADLIVFATGFEGNMKAEVSRLFGPEVASKADDFWGIDEEGELKGMWKPMRQRGLWYHCGSLCHARYCARWIALMIKAEEEGLGWPLYQG